MNRSRCTSRSREDVKHQQDGIVTVTSLLTTLLVTLHLAGDVVYGIAPGNLATLAVLVLVVDLWLYGTLLLHGRRALEAADARST